jgi:hypothetical protein
MSSLANKSNSVVIDARGPRFSAAITVIVLASAIATQSLLLTTFQLIVFLIGATKGPQFTPYAFLFKNLIKPRLKSEFVPEDVRPPKFAQTVGLLFTIASVVGLLTGVTAIFLVATGFALAAAFLNAAFNYCLGCEVYLLLLRARSI